MECPPDLTPTSRLAWAETYARRRWPIIPLYGKVPAVRRWQLFEATSVAVRFWFGNCRCNIGLRTGESGYVVVDTDTDEADAWVSFHLPETPMQAVSGRGYRHRYYRVPDGREIRNSQGYAGIRGVDVRGTGGYIVLPGSVHPETGRRYEWATEISLPTGLPAFPPSDLPERKAAVRSAVAGIVDPGRLAERARVYLSKIEPAVSGRGGHTKTFTTALKIARLVGGDADLLWQLLCEYNGRCEPPWTENELRHKWAEALRSSART
jgi:hypothetical protein